MGGKTYLSKDEDLCVERQDFLYFLVTQGAACAPGLHDAFDCWFVWVGGWGGRRRTGFEFFVDCLDFEVEGIPTQIQGEKSAARID